MNRSFASTLAADLAYALSVLAVLFFVLYR